jgi:hypothetical protein
MFAFYWAASTLSTAGMVGYTTPKNARELVFVIVCMLITLTIYAYVMGVLLSLASRFSAATSVRTSIFLGLHDALACLERRMSGLQRSAFSPLTLYHE